MKKKELSKDRIEVVAQKDRAIFIPLGLWVAKTIREVEQTCESILKVAYPKLLIFDLEKLEGFDTSGVWLIKRTIRAFESKNYRIEVQNANGFFLIYLPKLSS